MNITILSVGRLKKGPEKQLVDDYVDRFRKSGRQLGFRSLNLIDVEAGPSLEAEGARLLAKLPEGSNAIRLDEFGPQWTSKAFAQKLSKWRDDGVAETVFLIGGAAGYSHAVQQAVPATLAFGPQTWPHRLVKVMLSEQLYRAASLLGGLPYHKA
ncbi:MAG: 23S rRNA (pseudouridine(1915)-N(3))-methyltransferase RlmH [Henriciella sp.]|nr:23S rRNA (pseudouridine(1915)-N(3))-methyltransferase RlmH [Henriciella sp.]